MTNSFHFNDALQLLGIGMLTVFLILILVVLIGNLIIRFVNRFVPEEEKTKTGNKRGAVEQGKMAAIVAAVQSVTNGKGRIIKVEKI